jgi:hypothetical protein
MNHNSININHDSSNMNHSYISVNHNLSNMNLDSQIALFSNFSIIDPSVIEPLKDLSQKV